MVYGKVPPQARDLEEYILGAIMLERNAFSDAAEVINENCFYVEAHQRIFMAMRALVDKHQPVDIPLVCEQLRSTEELEMVGGPYYVSMLTNKVVSSANIVHHCRIVLQKFIQREVIRICGQLIGDAYEDSQDAFDLMDNAENEIYSIRQSSMKKQFKFLDTILVQTYQELLSLRERDQHLTGVTSGFDDLDYVTCGWQPTDLIIVAARPSVGKTAFALALARNAVRNSKKAVAIFSLEMKEKKLAHRLLAAESDVLIWSLTNARLDEDKMKQLYSRGVQPLAQAPIVIDDTSSIMVSEFRSKARRLVAKHGVQLFIIDYLQLMSSPAHITNREQQISHISRELKAAAGELGVPIIALSQLNRDIDKTKGREPQLSDLRESGAIEQDADMVIFLWRPSPEDILADHTLSDTIYVGIKKHRNGALAKLLGEFKKEVQRWNYLKVIDDNTLQPIGQGWKPFSVPQAVLNFSEPMREQKDLSIGTGSKMVEPDETIDPDALPF